MEALVIQEAPMVGLAWRSQGYAHAEARERLQTFRARSASIRGPPSKT